MHIITDSTINSLKRLFKKLTAPDAIAIICQIFGASNAVIYINEKQFVIYELTYDYHLNNLMAEDVDVKFFGGPNGGWFNGTLLTLLLDHALFCLSKDKSHKIVEAVRWMSEVKCG